MFVKKKVIFKVVLGLVFGVILTGVFLSRNSKTFAQNSGGNMLGLNVVQRSDQMDQGIKGYVKQNGWVAFMPNNAQAKDIQATVDEIVGVYFVKDAGQVAPVNYILRGYFKDMVWATSEKTIDASWTTFWAEVLKKVEPQVPAGSEFYFMPLNEPNLQGECNGIGHGETEGDFGCAKDVNDYINSLLSKYSFSGRIRLLSPSWDVSAPNFPSFVAKLKTYPGDFFSKFYGLAFNYFDFERECNDPLCNDESERNPGMFREMLDKYGFSGKKVFMVETGVVRKSPGYYQQPYITKMICALYNKFKDEENDSNRQLVMFSPITWDPEGVSGDWFFETEETRNFYQTRTSDCSQFIGENGGTPKGGELYGRDPYNRILSGSRYFPWKAPYCAAISSDQYSKNRPTEDFKLCSDPGSKNGITSCPDYSPNRPYPGDTCLDFEYMYNHDEKNPDIVSYSQDNFPIGGSGSMNLCNAATGLCRNVGDIQEVSTSDRTSIFFKNSFVDFLGTNNEYTSNPNYIMSLKNNVTRVATFLTDFLGGMTDIPGVTGRSHEIKDYLDAYLAYRQTGDSNALSEKLAAIPNLRENLQLISGVLGKTMPDAVKKQADEKNNTFIKRWALSNMPHTEGSYGADSTNMPVGDYVVAYKCAEGDGVLLNEEDFPDSLERRDAVSSRTKAKCGDKKVIPVRISDYVCSASHPEIWNSIADAFKYTDPKTLKTTSFTKKDICRGKEDSINDVFTQGKWIEADLATLKQYFVTAKTHEDTPVRVELSCPSNANPDSLPVYDNQLDEMEIRREGLDGANPVARYALSDGLDDFGKQKYKIIARTYIFVGHLAEARESSIKADEILLTSEAQKVQGQDFPEDELISNEKIQETVKAIESTVSPSSKGDLIAEDYVGRVITDPAIVMQQFYAGYQLSAKGVVDQNDIEPMRKWESGNKTGNLNKDVPIVGNCNVKVEIPYIREVAARTIGKTHGIYRLFFPSETQDVIDAQIKEDAKKGFGVSASQYATQKNGSIDANFFIPWLDAMKTWNSALNFGVNPLSAQKTAPVSPNDTENPNIKGKPDTPGDSCLTQGVNFQDPSVGDLKSNVSGSAFSRMIDSYKQSAIAKRSDGKELWDAAIDTAVAKGLNPYLALAYWGEETNFSSPINPNPKKGLGCGIMSGYDSNGHRLSCINGGSDKQDFLDEFKCFAASNSYSCNNACLGQSSTYDMIGCYQYGAGSKPGATHLKNLMYFYHLLKGDSQPNCTK